jgi:hypothetical protein
MGEMKKGMSGMMKGQSMMKSEDTDVGSDESGYENDTIAKARRNSL